MIEQSNSPVSHAVYGKLLKWLPVAINEGLDTASGLLSGFPDPEELNETINRLTPFVESAREQGVRGSDAMCYANIIRGTGHPNGAIAPSYRDNNADKSSFSALADELDRILLPESTFDEMLIGIEGLLLEPTFPDEQLENLRPDLARDLQSIGRYFNAHPDKSKEISSRVNSAGNILFPECWEI